MGKQSARFGPAVMIVLFIWAAMFIAALGLIHTYGTRSFPQNDELGALYDSGHGVHIRWLWKPWAEHRIPLAKLVWKSVLEVTDYDFRAGNFITVSTLAAVALLLIWTARRRRGRTKVTDAFFALAILNFGQAQVFLWWWQVNHVFAPVLVNLMLALMLLHGDDLQPRHASAIAGGLIILALCGPGGLTYVLAVALWLGLWTATKWPSLSLPQRRQCSAALALAAGALCLLILYFVNYTPYFPVNDPPSRSSWPPSPGLLASATAFFQILGLSLGTATKPYAAASGGAIFLLGTATIAILLRRWLKHPREHWSELWHLAFLGAIGILVAVIAQSRAGMGLDYIYQGHYLALLTPALCCIYFVWETRGGLSGRCVQFGLVFALAALLPLNVKHAIQTGEDLRRVSTAFERDVQRGVPAFVLAERYFTSDILPQPEKFTRILEEEKNAGVGVFREIRDNPPIRAQNIPVETAALNGLILRNDIASPATKDGGPGSLTFSLERRLHVYAIRLRYAYLHTTNGWPTLRIHWRDSAAQDFNEDAALASTVPGPDQPTWAIVNGMIRTNAKLRTERTLTVWVDQTIDQFRIDPDSAPCEFRLSKVEVLAP